MASIRTRRRRDGTTYYSVLWRDRGRQTSISVDDIKDAEHIKAWLDLTGQLPRVTRTTDAPTVEQLLIDHIDALSGVEARTISTYRALAAHHITPHLGRLPATDLTRGHVAKWVNTLAEAPTSRTGRPPRPKTIRNAHALLSAALATAVENGILPRNPAKGVRLPARDTKTGALISRDDLTAILAEMTSEWRRFFLLLAQTGMRWGEAAALTVGDVHRRTRTIAITKAVKRIDGAPNVIGTPKTDRSHRVLSIPASLMTDLLPLLVRPAGEQLFAGQTGGAYSSRPAHHAWMLATKAAGVAVGSTMKDLRSSHASWLLEDGVNPKVVQERLGHERISTTMEIYARVNRDADAAAAELLDGLGREPEALGATGALAGDAASP